MLRIAGLPISGYLVLISAASSSWGPPAISQQAPSSLTQANAEIRRLRAENDSLRRVIDGLRRHTGLAADKNGATGSILDRLNSYEASPFPATKYTDRETYDYRKRSGTPVPTKRMAFVEDVCLIGRADIDATFKPQVATEPDVRAVLEVYQTKDWQEIRGLRPWTHAAFVRSLTASQRQQLTVEVLQVLHSGRIGNDCE